MMTVIITGGVSVQTKPIDTTCLPAVVVVGRYGRVVYAVGEHTHERVLVGVSVQTEPIDTTCPPAAVVGRYVRVVYTVGDHTHERVLVAANIFAE